jgi:hypothetical protein
MTVRARVTDVNDQILVAVPSTRSARPDHRHGWRRRRGGAVEAVPSCICTQVSMST